MVAQILESIGLDPAEAKVYLCSLKLGTQDVSTIAKETGLTSQNTASLLLKLLEKGFVSRYSSRKDFFRAEPPSIVLQILEHKNEEMRGKVNTFKKQISKLEALASPTAGRPEIALYEGNDGLIAAWEDTLTSKTEILAITNVDDTESRLPKYVPRYYKRRKAAGILIKAIFPDTKIARERQKKDSQEFRVSRLVPKELMSFHIELNIYDDKVAFFAVEEEIAIIVTSKVISNSLRNVFDICWQMASLYDPKALKTNEKKVTAKKSTKKKSKKKS